MGFAAGTTDTPESDAVVGSTCETLRWGHSRWTSVSRLTKYLSVLSTARQTRETLVVASTCSSRNHSLSWRRGSPRSNQPLYQVERRSSAPLLSVVPGRESRTWRRKRTTQSWLCIFSRKPGQVARSAWTGRGGLTTRVSGGKPAPCH